MANSMMTTADLHPETGQYAGAGAISLADRSMGFQPAFLDQETGRVYRSRFRNGSPAAFHLLDGLPETLVLRRTASGRALAVKGTLVAGFLRNGRFYTRDAASHLLASRGAAGKDTATSTLPITALA